MSAAGENVTVYGATNRISPYKMSAAGEKMGVRELQIGFYLTK